MSSEIEWVQVPRWLHSEVLELLRNTDTELSANGRMSVRFRNAIDLLAASPPSSATPGGRQAPPNDQWCIGCTPEDCSGCGPQPQEAACCTCPSGDGSLRWPCPKHPPELYPQPQERAHTDHCDFNAASSGDPACTCQPQEREADYESKYATAERLAKHPATIRCDFCGVSPGELHAFDCVALDTQPQERAGSEAGAWKQPVVCTCHTERQRELCMQRKECVVAYATGNQVKATRPQPASDASGGGDMDVERFDVGTKPYQEGAAMVREVDGDWVRYDDYADLARALTAPPGDHVRLLRNLKEMVQPANLGGRPQYELIMGEQFKNEFVDALDASIKALQRTAP